MSKISKKDFLPNVIILFLNSGAQSSKNIYHRSGYIWQNLQQLINEIKKSRLKPGFYNIKFCF